MHHYQPQTKLLEGNVSTPVCDSVHRGWGGMHDQGGMHGRGYVWQGVMHGGGHTWQERWPLKRAVRILLECILVKYWNSLLSVILILF